MKVTAKQLREKGACEDQVAVFVKEWPQGVTVTVESLARAHALRLDVDWWIGTLPATIRAEYQKKVATMLCQVLTRAQGGRVSTTSKGNRAEQELCR